jgi:hypothetical protein
MKIITNLVTILALTGCMCKPKPDVSIGEIPEKPATPTNETVSTKYPNNFVACRHFEKNRIDSIVNAATASGKDVVLYFHGGLSKQDYMINDLGPKLMQRVFAKGEAGEELYPLFFNYDAHLLDDWKTFFNDINSVLKGDSYKKLRDQLSSSLNVNAISKELLAVSNESYRLGAANLINDFKARDKLLVPLTEKTVNENEEYYINLIKADTLPAEFFVDTKTLAPGLGTLAEYIVMVDDNYKSSKDATSIVGTERIDIDTAALRIIRILARYAIGSDHGFFATIQEEVLDAVGVSKIGIWHWDKVKRHSKECFAKQSNGKFIVDALLENGVNIHTLSHSAGSITTAELINYLGSIDKQSVLKNVIMLVPAINQYVFDKHVVNNQSVYDRLFVYMLSEEYERKDEVLNDLLYSSSLLYAVSSLAEGEKTLDQMLLIDQHLTQKRPPYDNSLYLKIACENPEPVWNYFSNVNNATYKEYPFPGGIVHSDAPSHEGTKHPWISKDLAKEYLGILSGER